jgi:DNA-binding IscR family transcriptional regulator
VKISTRGEYGIRAMLYLATHAGGRAVTSHEIAREQAIPEQDLRVPFDIGHTCLPVIHD